MPVIGGRAHDIKQIHEVGRLGYDFAEISLLEPAVVENQYNELMDLKDKYGMYYLAHYPNEGNPSDSEMLQEKFIPKMKKLINLTQKLGIKKGTMHFWIDKRWASDSLIITKIDLLSELVEYAKAKDVTICLENLTERYDSFSAAFDKIPDLRMTMDIGHGELLASKNTLFGFTEHVFQKIEHIHVHDNLGGTTVEDDLHLALGEGTIDYPKILTILKEKEYNDTISMEVKPVDMPKTLGFMERYL